MIKTLTTEKSGKILRLGRKRWTYDDLCRMPESMDRLEIIDGVLYMSPSAHVLRHQNAVSNLLYELTRWAREHGAGKVFTAPADVVASDIKVVQPDVFFVAADRLDIVGAYVDGAPDLVAEVISPSSITYDRETKFFLYQEIGVREYWLVDPEAQTVEVFALRDGQFQSDVRAGSGETARSTLLNGFEVEVNALFA